MTTMVCFRKAASEYGLPVDAVRAVRPAVGLVPMPQPREGFAGIAAEDPPFTVVAPFGAGGHQVIVLDVSGQRFGVLVDEVSGLQRVDDTRVGAPPAGQRVPLISGTVHADGRLLLLADPHYLAGQL